jgi:hypothetical protein
LNQEVCRTGESRAQVYLEVWHSADEAQVGQKFGQNGRGQNPRSFAERSQVTLKAKKK